MNNVRGPVAFIAEKLRTRRARRLEERERMRRFAEARRDWEARRLAQVRELRPELFRDPRELPKEPIWKASLTTVLTIVFAAAPLLIATYDFGSHAWKIARRLFSSASVSPSIFFEVFFLVFYLAGFATVGIVSAIVLWWLVAGWRAPLPRYRSW